MVATWARTALDGASARFAAAMGARVYVNAYDALEGLANRFPLRRSSP
jgi:hypothetical protein